MRIDLTSALNFAVPDKDKSLEPADPASLKSKSTPTSAPEESRNLGLDNYTNGPQPPHRGPPLLQQDLHQPTGPVSLMAAAPRPDNGDNSVLRPVRTLNSSGSAHAATEMAPVVYSSLNLGDSADSDVEATPQGAPGEHAEPLVVNRLAANGLPSIPKCLSECVNCLKVRKFDVLVVVSVALLSFLIGRYWPLQNNRLGDSFQCNCNTNGVSHEVFYIMYSLVHMFELIYNIRK